MYRLHLLIVLLAAPNLKAQDHATNYDPTPTKGDSDAYARVYELYFAPLAKISQTEKLLLRNGEITLQELNDRELLLLCDVYSEHPDATKMLETANVLWCKSSDEIAATIAISNALQRRLPFPDGQRETIDFVEKALSENKGNRRILLLLKAHATLVQKNAFSEAEKRDIVGNILVEAASAPLDTKNVAVVAQYSPSSIVNSSIYLRYFSSTEREDLIRRMTERKLQPSSGGREVNSNDKSEAGNN